MTTFAAAGFLTVVTELVRIGGVMRDNHRARLREKSFSVLLPNVPRLEQGSQAYEAFMLDFAHRHKAWWEPAGSPLEGLYVPGREAAILRADADVNKLQRACDMAVAELNRDAPVVEVALEDGADPLDTSAVIVLKQWDEDPNAERNRWRRLGATLALSTVSVVGSDPNMLARLGVQERTRNVIGAVAQNLVEIVGQTPLDQDPSVNFGERAAELFVRATMETLVEQPSLIIEKPHLAALFKSVAAPLSAEVQKDGRLQPIALKRMGELLRGPVAMGALNVLNTHSDAFLTGDAGKDGALGAVLRSVLGEIVATDQPGFELMQLFSGAGANLVLNAALETAQERPELFIDGQGRNTETARLLLRGVAEKVRLAPRPFNWKSGLVPEITSVALDTAAVYLRQKLTDDSDGSDWSKLGIDVGHHLIDEILLGFKSMAKPGGEREVGYNPFEHLFTRTQAIDILRMIATRAAETPGMIVNDKANPEVRNIAAAIFRFVADDTNRLLTADDWRGVIGVALSEAAKNPGALFSIKAENSPEKQLGVVLIGRILTRAGANLAAGEGRQPGAILFGETLREAISVTLRAAANSAKALLPGTHESRADALEAFINDLLAKASGDREDLRMGAAEWLYVYRWFVAHVIDTGSATDITPEQISALLRQIEAPGAGAASPPGAMT